MTRVLVTGAGGQLGQCFKQVATAYPHFSMVFKTKHELDITHTESLQSFLKHHPIEVLINCAAYTAVDAAETNPSQALLLNHRVVSNLAKLAQSSGFKLVHFSTDYVFSGTQKTPYREDDPTAPINRYGQSKRLGEEALFQASASAICIRTSWLFSPFGNNFVKNILGRLAEGQALKVVDDQWARPTYGIDLAHAVLGLLNHPKADQHHCYHFANSGVTNWYGLAQAIARQRGLETTITPLPSDQYPTAAHRPTHSVLDTLRIENTCNLVPRSWEEALKDCLHYL